VTLAFDTLYRDHRRYLWALGYRMMGSAADADDLVQETFARALAHPPSREDEPLRPWLVRVEVNLARDHLRRRRVRGYEGPWLPAPIETGPGTLEHELISTEPLPESRYSLRESATFAFLIALEALTPHQRAVLVLRDVLDYSGRETAAALGSTEASVKQTHRRARTAMSSYDEARATVAPSPEVIARTQAVAADDVAAAEAALSADVRAITDAGGEFLAARVPVLGAAKVALFFTKLARTAGRPELTPRFAIREINGVPALVAEYDFAAPNIAPRFVIHIDVGADGLIREVHGQQATAKLTAISAV